METAAGNAAGGLHLPMRPQSQFQGHRSVPAVQHSSGSTEWSSPRDQVFVTAMRYHLHRSFECAYFYELCFSEGLLAGQYQSKPAWSALRENDVQLRHGMTVPKFYSSPILHPPALQKRRTEIMDIDMQKLRRQKEKVCNGISIADLWRRRRGSNSRAAHATCHISSVVPSPLGYSSIDFQRLPCRYG